MSASGEKTTNGFRWWAASAPEARVCSLSGLHAVTVRDFSAACVSVGLMNHH
ncbi:MAG: hypothetical protein CM15mP74_00150 [Halieaceae bacterium]|nr:MAG: hypothetical protein CM15mP74_00150 [Halieaceae bacterium]